jgi:glycolate oxidase FAD binding subunit
MENSRALHDELRHIVGASGVLSEAASVSYAFDGCLPKAVVLPRTVQEIQDVLQFAAKQDLSVMPAGTGTKLGIGNLPPKVDIVLTTTHLNSVVEYEPADLTVTVEAGIRLADLQTELAKHRQYLALNPPYAERCTIGGIVATNTSGSFRLRHGTARNQVLGMRVVQSGGTVVKSGGKVVKNVSGYDLNKLYIGSFGTLGIITELTFKLYPLTESGIMVLLRFKRVKDAAETASEIASSQLLPSYLNLFVNGVPDTRILDPSVVVGLDSHPKAITWQRNQVQWIAKQNRAIGVEIIQERQAAELVEAMRAFTQASSSHPVIVCKANLRMSDIEGYIEVALEVTNAFECSVRAMGLMGTGQVYLVFSEFANTVEPKTIAFTLARLREHASSIGGNLILETAPIEVKRHIDVWGAVGDSFDIMKKIKVQFDPGRLLNPGRFVAGI